MTASVKLATSHGNHQAPCGKYMTGRQRHKRLGIWYVRGLNGTGKLHILKNCLKEMDIIAGTHWRKSGHFQTSNGNLMIYFSNLNESIYGVTIILVRPAMLEYKTISDRIAMVKFRATSMDVNISQIYAPINFSTEIEWIILYETMRKISK